jgi:hypothetical protein
MTTSVKVSPPNSIIFIEDSSAKVVGPTFLPQIPRIAATSTRIVVCCWPEQDGPTEITMLQQPMRTPDDSPALDQMLETPGREVAVWTVERRKLLHAHVASTRTRVRIWTNHPTWPDKVFIGLG